MLNPIRRRCLFMAKEIVFPNGIYNNIHELIETIIDIACKELHFYFKQSSGGKVYISINCEKCKMLHHINFSNNLLGMLDFSAIISSKHKFYSKLAICKPNSRRDRRENFSYSDLIRRRGSDIQLVGYWNSEPYSL